MRDVFIIKAALEHRPIIQCPHPVPQRRAVSIAAGPWNGMTQTERYPENDQLRQLVLFLIFFWQDFQD
ncbi:MAG: hypothetical protein ACPLUI_00415 [Desulfofundulus sp.]